MQTRGADIRQLKRERSIKATTRTAPGAVTGSPSTLSSLLAKEYSFSSSKLDNKTREAFYLELAILLEAGVDIKTSLELLGEEQKKERLSTLFMGIKEAIISGSSLSQAAKRTGEFSNYEYYSLQIGEESGKLIPVLYELAQYFHKKVDQRRQIIKALSYPSVVLLTAVGAVFFMISFVIPMFSDVFKQLGGDLPVITKFVIRLSTALRVTFPYLAAGLAAVVGLLFSQKEKFWFKKYSSLLLMKLPLAGNLISRIYLARFSYSMTLLIGSKVPLLRAIDLVKQMIAFYPIEQALSAVEGRILEGKTLHYGMSEHSIFPRKMVSLIKVGEEVNQLEEFFAKLAKQYSDEVEYQTAIISSLIEPVMLIFLGLIVGTILISMYLPLFSLGSAV